MFDERNTQWHPAFTGAIHMEFLKGIYYISEYSEICIEVIVTKEFDLLKNEFKNSFQNRLCHAQSIFY